MLLSLFVRDFGSHGTLVVSYFSNVTDLLVIFYSSNASQLLEMKDKGEIYCDTMKFLGVMCISMLSCFLHPGIFSMQKYCELFDIF